MGYLERGEGRGRGVAEGGRDVTVTGTEVVTGKVHLFRALTQTFPVPGLRPLNKAIS